MVPGTHPGRDPWKIRDPHSSSRERLRKTNPQVSPLNTRKQGEERPQRQMPKWTLSHKSAHKACPARYRPQPADILRHMPTATLHPSRTFARSRQWPSVDTLRGGEIALLTRTWGSSRRSESAWASGMAGDWIVQGHFFPVYGKGSPWRRWPCHMKDKGLPWRRADAKGRIQHNNSTLTLVHPAIGPWITLQSGHVRVTRRQWQGSQ